MRGKRRPHSVWLQRRKWKGSATYIMRWVNPLTGREETQTAGSNRAHAKDLAAAKSEELKRVLTGSRPRTTITELADLAHTWMAGKARQTRDETRRSIRRLAELTDNRPIEYIDREQLLTYRAARLAAGLRAATANKELREISAGLSYGVDAGRLDVNPCWHWPRGKLAEPQKRIRVVEPAEFAALLAAARADGMDPLGDDQFAGILTLGWYEGLRRREICHLRWESVDLATATLHVENYRADTAAGDQFTKSKRVRTTPMRSAALEWLTARWNAVPKTITAGRIAARVPTVFYWPEDGRPVSRYWLSHQMKLIVSKAGIKPATYHDLRRSFSTLAQRAGISPETVRDLGGWSTVDVVKRHYTGEVPDGLRTAIQKLDAQVG